MYRNHELDEDKQREFLENAQVIQEDATAEAFGLRNKAEVRITKEDMNNIFGVEE